MASFVNERRLVRFGFVEGSEELDGGEALVLLAAGEEGSGFEFGFDGVEDKFNVVEGFRCAEIGHQETLPAASCAGLAGWSFASYHV